MRDFRCSVSSLLLSWESRVAYLVFEAGALLGVTAGLLWTSAGFIQFAYAEEQDKAKVTPQIQHLGRHPVLILWLRSTLHFNGS
jgi:hypothetical protein